jgi:DNA ligase (NAD+)
MVIPEVVEVLKSRRPATHGHSTWWRAHRWQVPGLRRAHRPEKVSGGEADEVAWRCQNVAGCPAQMTRRVEYFAQRKALDIESLGGIVAEKLVESGLVSEPLDLFNLTLDQLAKLNLGTPEEPRVFGEKNATKVIEALERAKRAPLHRWILALAIPEVGEQTAWQLAQVHRSCGSRRTPVLHDIRRLGQPSSELDAISPDHAATCRGTPRARDAQREYASLGAELSSVEQRLAEGGLKARLEEVGPVAATSVLDFLATPTGQGILDRLDQLGIQPAASHPTAVAPTAASALEGRTLVLTGTLPTVATRPLA